MKNHPEHGNCVWEAITSSLTHDDSLRPLLQHVDEIARELNAQGAFTKGSRGWVLSSTAWDKWVWNDSQRFRS